MKLTASVRDNRRREPGFLNRSINLWLYPAGDKGSIAHLSSQVILRKPEAEFSLRFHIGSKASETPWDGHLIILGSGIYWGWSRGRRLAHLITSARQSRIQRKPQYLSRDLQLSGYKSMLRWNLWTRENHSVRRVKGKKFRSWAHRDGSISLNPIRHIYGPLNYFYKDLDRHVGSELHMIEGSYPVILTLQEVTRGRVKSKKRTFQNYVVDVDAPRGVPTHFDKSGGWKGDRTYGFGVGIPDHIARHGLRGGDWHVDALNLVESWVLKQRGSTGFREAQKEDVT